jgi:hypothetical protein
MKQRVIDLGSARVSRAGDGVSPSRTFLSGRARKKARFGETPNPVREACALPRHSQ